MIEIPLNRDIDKFLYRQLADHLEKMILRGTLADGERLPGSRPFSSSLGVSRMTVVDAYHHLEDKGLIVQRGRSGAFVNFDNSMVPHRKGYVSNGLSLSMEGELPSPWLVPSNELARLSKDILTKEGPYVLRGAPLTGVEELRKSLVSHAASRGIPASWEEVLVTSGGRQGLSVAFGAFRSLGILQVFMDRLNYPCARTFAEKEGLEVKLFDGVEELLQLLQEAKPQSMVYIVPSFANPTGLTVSFDMRESLLELCRQRNIWILEDDAYGELRYGHKSVSALRALDDGRRTIYMGSFSQTLFPGFRLGYFLLPSSLYDIFASSLALRGGPTSSLVQYISSRFIQSGGLSDALDVVRMEMASRMRALLSALECLKGCRYTPPQGGIYLWLETPGLSGRGLSDSLRKKGLMVAPGDDFDLSCGKVEALRLSVSDIEISKIGAAVQILENVITGGL